MKNRKIIVNPIYAKPGQSIQFEQLTDGERKKIGTECGPAGGSWYQELLEWIVPELIFNFACQYHDFLYFLGGTEHDRLLADKQFLLDMKWLASKQKKRYRFFYKRLAGIYYRAVRRFGDNSFEYRSGKLTWREYNLEKSKRLDG